jgi:imidazoleglycerol-phosphate dehydratase
MMASKSAIPAREGRSAVVERATRETTVKISLDLDGTGKSNIATGVRFLDHMLAQVAAHGLLDLEIEARGDLDVDAHHTVEDVAIMLGQAIDRALGERQGIARMGDSIVPMDEALALVALDLSGRGYAVVDVEFAAPMLGTLATSLIPHFFESLALNARMNLHAKIFYGRDDHHKAEALFKAFGRALVQAVAIEPRRGTTSTKEALR